jgi:hypothetical protein
MGVRAERRGCRLAVAVQHRGDLARRRGHARILGREIIVRSRCDHEAYVRIQATHLVCLGRIDRVIEDDDRLDKRPRIGLAFQARQRPAQILGQGGLCALSPGRDGLHHDRDTGLIGHGSNLRMRTYLIQDKGSQEADTLDHPIPTAQR